MAYPLSPSAEPLAGERDALESVLARMRAIIVDKGDGLSDEQAGRHLVPSLTTIGGLVKHLRWAEHGWFGQVFTEHTGQNVRPHDRDWEFTMSDGETLAGLVADYRAQWQRSAALTEGHDLDELVPHIDRGQVSLRWIYLHLIQETARHAGHIDILREQIDGQVGMGDPYRAR